MKISCRDSFGLKWRIRKKKKKSEKTIDVCMMHATCKRWMVGDVWSSTTDYSLQICQPGATKLGLQLMMTYIID